MSKKSSNYRGPCIIEHCDNDATFKEAQLCNACYQGMYYWTSKRQNKSPTDILKRQRQLKVYSSRMAALTPVRIRLVVNNREKVRAIR